ncbi:MAG TPA: sensor domain-containing diguanylate cyclase [Mycobacteriales bacterium]|jgi:diguanylate cyclase (GGDEF)-like protein|nr:sensor domain-containing diguanylate cyclase [Mycobacteriales bacterium]
MKHVLGPRLPPPPAADRRLSVDERLPARVSDALSSLTAVAAAASALSTFEDLLEVTAEEARVAIGASSLSISRMEPGGDYLRTLVNVGLLSPGEQRRPIHEVYRLSDFPVYESCMRSGQVYVARLDDPDCDSNEHALLVAVEKKSSISVPIMHGDDLWGELWATTDHTRSLFSTDDVHLLQAVTERVQPAIAQAELLARLSRYAYEDHLTGLVNRRAFQERLERTVGRAKASRHVVTLVMADVDGLKQVNDSGGHDAGDRLLKKVGDILRGCIADRHDAVACRTGGDEFCLLFDGATVEDATRAIETAVLQLGREGIGLSYGVAASRSGDLTPSELLAAADAAQYRAKHDRGRLRTVRSFRDAVPLAELTVQLARQVSQSSGLPLDERLHQVCERAASALNAPEWSLTSDGSAASTAVPSAQLVDRLLTVTLAVDESHFAARFELRFEPADAAAIRHVVRWALLAAAHGG